ncbi:MAG: hypothetical protein B7733_05955 [Myxococcales bacterium FL481]|nr:MAG: hypothetical protein B7733_05955 [Myxococcales bacterium FL481]
MSRTSRQIIGGKRGVYRGRKRQPYGGRAAGLWGDCEQCKCHRTAERARGRGEAEAGTHEYIEMMDLEQE